MNKIINSAYCSSINNIEIIKQSHNHYKCRLLKELTELSKQSDLHINTHLYNTSTIVQWNYRSI